MEEQQAKPQATEEDFRQLQEDILYTIVEECLQQSGWRFPLFDENWQPYVPNPEFVQQKLAQHYPAHDCEEDNAILSNDNEDNREAPQLFDAREYDSEACDDVPVEH